MFIVARIRILRRGLCLGGVIFISASLCFAGMDFTKLDGRPQLPVFKTRIEAKAWANKIFWIPEMEDMLREKRAELRQSSLKSNGIMRKDDDTFEQWDPYGVALETMMYYKKRNMRGNPGAVLYAGSIPI